MRRSIALFAASLSLTLGACSAHTPESTHLAAGSAGLKNPTDITLVTGATLISVQPFSQTVPANSDTTSGLTSQGAGTYAGDEVLAESPQSNAELDDWLASLRKSPPAGYATVPQASASVVRRLDDYGIAFAAFRKTESAGPRGVCVVVMDPKRVRTQLGFVIEIADRYRDLPESMRQSIDQNVKAKAGISVSEALDPSSPIGMTLSAVQQLQTTDDRAIIIVDATKKP
jgi:hypothetical protein